MNKYNFTDLLTKEVIENQVFSKIEIPMIQRDYAQGRDSQKEVRNRFLTAIFEALTKGSDLTLDFVYGSVENNNFIPLDGQQRLTTLFLLYWYIGSRELQEKDRIGLKESLSKFTYSTRTSSRRFCEMLTQTRDDKGNQKEYLIEFAKNPSDEIENLSWFFKAYKKDPTIQAMLNMLDAIHEKYAGLKKLFGNLDKLQFYVLPLDNFNLTEDLYIKMNARGKQLTAFENFKADFEKNIKQNKWEEETEYKQTFAFKADTLWTDLFWKHKNEENEIDASYIEFIANVAIFLYAELHTTLDRTVIEKRMQELFNHPEKVNSSDFASVDKFNILIKYLDLYANTTNKFDEKTVDNLWNSEDNLFKQILSDKATYPQRVLFFAQTLFLENNFTTGFEDWMRVVRNILQNSIVDSSSTFVGAINLINEISVGAKDIYTWLSTNSVKSNFAKKQVEEEIVKSKIVIQSTENKTSIHQIEDTNFCKGRIDFALYCIDSNTLSTIGNFTSQKLNSIKTVFDNHLTEDDISNDFRRAMFTIGNNDFYYHLSWSYNLGMHKYCLLLDTNDLRNRFAFHNHNYLKDLVNQLSTDTLGTIISNFTNTSQFLTLPNWKQRLIKEVDKEGKNLLDNHCSGHYFGIKPDNSCCYLFYERKRPSSKGDCKKVM